ncbi:Aspartic peptidase, partial [Corchorus capsularis]
MGRPLQTYELDVDTGSSLIWVQCKLGDDDIFPGWTQ